MTMFASTRPTATVSAGPHWTRPSISFSLVMVASMVQCAAPMLFTPSADTEGHVRTNWDNWGHVYNGTWFLYYIVGGECPGRWVAYGVATSTDGVRWTDLGDMLYPLTEVGPRRQSCGNADYALGSGWVWQSPADGRWLVDWSQTNPRGRDGPVNQLCHGRRTAWAVAQHHQP
eukprot:m.224938 g.224938  ORF g.224938 m.224938 type:complete len:173 (-) comp34592_c0_seq1:12-530(-)